MQKFYNTYDINWDNLPKILDVFNNGYNYSFNLEHISIEAGVGSTRSKPHSHNIYHIVLYLEGAGRIYWEDRMVNIQKGSLFLCSPGIKHHFCPDEKVPFKYAEITFSLKDNDNLNISMLELLKYYCGLSLKIVDSPVQLNARQIWQFEQSFLSIFKNISSGEDVAWFNVYDNLANIFNFIIKEIHFVSDRDSAADSLTVAKQYIDQSFNKTFSIDYIARKTGMSKGYFQRRFKMEFGVSPIAYQNQVRIKVAKRLLIETGLNISEISERIGLENPHYFSRLFKKHCGISPLSYRKSL